MKILMSLCFLAVSIGAWSTAYRFQQNPAMLRGEVSAFRGLAYQVAMLVLAFLCLWILTSIFPLQLIVVLIGAVALGHLLHYLIGAISGFALKEKRRKIAALLLLTSFESNFARGLAGKGMATLIKTLVVMALLSLTIIALWVSTLWVYWSHPIGDSQAILWIVLFQFTLPAVLGMAITLALMWPAVTSEFLDDDLRNFYISWGFSVTLYMTVYLLFPAWLFGPQVAELLGFAPSFWLLACAPLLIFLGGFVLPFFIGMNMHRNRARELSEWRRRWLSQLSTIVQLPKGELREQSLNEQIARLDAERETQLAQNPLFKFYLYIATGDLRHFGPAGMLTASRIESHSRTLFAPEPGAQVLVEETTSVATSDSRPLIEHQPEVSPARRLDEVKKILDTRQWKQAVDIMWESRNSLASWDVRFNHVQELNSLRQIAALAQTGDVKAAVNSAESAEKESGARRGRRNVIGASLIAAFGSLIVVLVKACEPQLTGLLNRVAPISTS